MNIIYFRIYWCSHKNCTLFHIFNDCVSFLLLPVVSGVSRWKLFLAICDCLWTWNVFIPWEKTQNIEKELPSVHCVIFHPINSAWGYYIFNGYSINCSFFSLVKGCKIVWSHVQTPPCVWHYNSWDQMDETAACNKKRILCMRICF